VRPHHASSFWMIETETSSNAISIRRNRREMNAGLANYIEVHFSRAVARALFRRNEESLIGKIFRNRMRPQTTMRATTVHWPKWLWPQIASRAAWPNGASGTCCDLSAIESRRPVSDRRVSSSNERDQIEEKWWRTQSQSNPSPTAKFTAKN
jgi:hypothetical protein